MFKNGNKHESHKWFFKMESRAFYIKKKKCPASIEVDFCF